MTLTGSIGVFGMIPSFGKALKDKVGVTIDGVKTNKYSNMGNGFSPLSSVEHVFSGANEDLFTNIYSQVHGWCLLAQAELSHYGLAHDPPGRLPVIFSLTTEATPPIPLCLPSFFSTLP